jgi:hypothetical protein
MKKRWVALIAVSSLVGLLIVTRSFIARSYPGIPAYYSFDGGVFSYSNSFHQGQVGPFVIGQTKLDAIVGLNNIGSSFILPMQMSTEHRDLLYFTRLEYVTPLARQFLLSRDSWRIAIKAQGATIVYEITFENGRARRIHVSSTLMA